jgi:hypothetical protein
MRLTLPRTWDGSLAVLRTQAEAVQRDGYDALDLIGTIAARLYATGERPGPKPDDRVLSATARELDARNLGWVRLTEYLPRVHATWCYLVEVRETAA